MSTTTPPFDVWIGLLSAEVPYPPTHPLGHRAQRDVGFNWPAEHGLSGREIPSARSMREAVSPMLGVAVGLPVLDLT